MLRDTFIALLNLFLKINFSAGGVVLETFTAQIKTVFGTEAFELLELSGTVGQDTQVFTSFDRC